MTTVVKWRI